VFKLFGSWFLSKSNFEDSKEAFFVNSHETLFTRFPDINNFFFSNINDLVKTFNLSAEHLGNPEGFIHEAFSSFDCDELLAFTKEESESS